MKKELEGGVELKRYLLGEVAREERELIEERLFLDREYLFRLQEVEDELIDDYLYNDLPVNERAQFEANFLSKPERYEDVRFAKALKLHLAEETGEATVSPATAPGETLRPRTKDKVSFFPFLSRHKSTPRFALAFAALVILLACVWFAVEFVRRKRDVPMQAQGTESPQTDSVQPQQREEATANGNTPGVEREGRDPNDAGREEKQREEQTPPQERRTRGAPPVPKQGRTVVALLLPGGGVRGEGETISVAMASDVSSVTLHLPLIEKENYRSYRAALENGGRTILTWAGLKHKTAEAGKIVSVSVPASKLDQQSYRIKLGGVTADGQTRDLYTYSFRVEKK